MAKNDIKISFVGNNAIDVTGSCIHIQTPHHQILLECGLTQTNNFIESYIVNSKKFDFKAKDIDWCFALHPHIDHIGLIPRLLKEGFKGKIVSTYNTSALAKPLLENSQFLINNEAGRLSKKRGKQVEPLYTANHVSKTFECWDTYGYSELIQLSDEVSFKFLHNSHTLGAAQLLLYIKNSLGVTKTILYTSDLGSMELKQYYTSDMDYADKCNIAIVESTYGARNRGVTKKDREEDLKQLKSSIINICKFRGGRVFIPSFAFGRSQFITTLIYELFKNEEFKPKVLVDSVLTCNLNKVFCDILTGEDLKRWQEVLQYDNIECISENYLHSKEMQNDLSPKVIISSSGYLTGGRSVQYLKSILPRQQDMMLFVGYAPPESLAGRIKHGNSKKTISIEGEPYKNLCSFLDLKSFSGHIQRHEMLNYYGNINCEKIYLVHGNMDGRVDLKEDLEKIYSDKLKTTKVIIANKETICNI